MPRRDAAADDVEKCAGGFSQRGVGVGGDDEDLVNERVAGGPFEFEVDREDAGVGGELLVQRVRAAEDPFAGAGGPGVATAFAGDGAGLNPLRGELVALREKAAVGRGHFAFVTPEQPGVEERPVFEGEGGGWRHV